jgi:hypothetical protein
MNIRIGVAAATLLVIAACTDASQPTDPQASASPSVSPTSSNTQWVVAPGRIGPVEVGMTLEEAQATGAVEPNKPATPDVCPAPSLQWKAPNTHKLDLRDHDGRIAVMGVRDAMFKTAEGVGVDSTWEELQAAYPGAKIEGSPASGSLLYRKDGDKWLAIAFNEQPEDLKPASEVVYMEVEVGQKPIAYPDGC